MGAETPNAVFTFETPRQTLVAETVLRRALIHHQEVPPPDGAESGCAVALRIPLDALYQAIGALATEDAEWQAVYQLGETQEVIAKLG
jgi:hypothetical protein